MIGTSMSNQTILIVLVLIVLIILSLIWYVLSHKYEAGRKTGGAQESDRLDGSDAGDNYSEVDINKMVNSESGSHYSHYSGKSNKSYTSYMGSGGYRLSFDPDTYKLLLEGKKHYELRAFSKYYDEKFTSEKSGQPGKMPKKGDDVILARSRPEEDTKEYPRPFRFKAKFGKVEKYDNLTKALEAYGKHDKDTVDAMKKSFEKYNAKNTELLEGPVLLFELVYGTNEINEALEHVPKIHNKADRSVFIVGKNNRRTRTRREDSSSVDLNSVHRFD